MTGFLGANLSYPDYFDSLVDSSGKMYAGLLFNPLNVNSQNTFAAVGSVATTGSNGQAIYQGTLSAGQAASLTLGGINNLMVMNTSTSSPPTFNATFPNPTGAGPYVGLPGTTGASVAVNASALRGVVRR